MSGSDRETSAETLERIARARERLGDRVLVLGHHYERDDVLRFADRTGDSFQLAREAAEEKDRPFIVFCGVHFMAETADILTDDDQAVLLPDLEAGCSLADFADAEQVALCWDAFESVRPARTVPITYVNSTAAIKAFCGERGGLACTSANALSAFRWALGRGERILFVPDEHLGRNTARSLGIGEEETAVWDPARTGGGVAPDRLAGARVILWKGRCDVHTHFRPEHVDAVRLAHPGIRVMVHPECPAEVVERADASGSTGQIIRAVREGGAGLTWAIGTEWHLVNRLAHAYEDRKVINLTTEPSVCPTMNRITPKKLLHVLERLLEGEAVNRIVVPAEIALPARKALDRMLTLA
ncbi:MAG: quinolinate synthase NadA [Candidatus Eisenbacteria bacterium]|nr:quinolinate synthase NadA [Candidatus Eisenbacteria bacterium]